MKLVKVMVLGALVALPSCKKEDKKETPPAKAVDPKPMAKEEPKPEPPKPLTADEMAKHYVDCWGYLVAKDWKQFEGCYTKDVASEFVDSGQPATTGWQARHDAHDLPFVAAFPDFKADVELTLINGKNGVTVAHLMGTHTGPLKSPAGEIPPTNKKMGLQAVHLAHFTEDGRSVDKEEFIWDVGTLMGQLGVSKAPVRAATDKPFQANEIVIAKDDEKEKKNLQTITAMTDAFNKHDSKALDAMMADDLVWSELGIPVDFDRKAASAAHDDLWKGFSDLKLNTSSAWAAGDYVVQRGTMAGTNDGEVKTMKLKKTGKPVSLNFIQIYKLNGDGKISRSWGFWNGIAMATQLGLMPPPGGAPGGDMKAPAGDMKAPAGDAKGADMKAPPAKPADKSK